MRQELDDLNDSLGGLLTNYNLVEKTNCFDFSDPTENRAVSFSYFKQGATNAPEGSGLFGILITYRVSENIYLINALTTSGLKYCFRNNSTGNWK